MLLQEVNSSIEGLQHTTLGPVRNFNIVSGEFVKLLHTRSDHWVCVSSIGSLPGHVNDSLYHDVISQVVEDQTKEEREIERKIQYQVREDEKKEEEKKEVKEEKEGKKVLKRKNKLKLKLVIPKKKKEADIVVDEFQMAVNAAIAEQQEMYTKYFMESIASEIERKVHYLGLAEQAVLELGSNKGNFSVV